MITKAQPYSEYKESDIEWLGKIPRDWEVDKITLLFNFSNEKVNDIDFEPLSVTYGGVKKQVKDAAKTDDGSNRKLLKIGDIAFNGRSDRRGRVEFLNMKGLFLLYIMS
jgi:type I restriction enzyme, S subunit